MIISELKAAVDLTKSIADAINAAKNYDPQLLSRFNELHSKVLNAYNVEIDLRRRIEELESELALKKMVYVKEPGAYRHPEDTEGKELFCQKCFDADKKLCRLHETDFNFFCSVCNFHVATKEQRVLREKRDEQRRLRQEAKMHANRYARNNFSPW